MYEQEETWVSPTEHRTRYERTLVIGDLHGDLEILLRSLASKGLLQFNDKIDPVLGSIRANLDQPYIVDLEAMVLPQKEATQLIFLGDILDRWNQGYHILQFLMKVRWEKFAIEPVYVMGNHDAHNFHFFTNPYRAYLLYEGGEFPLPRRMEYIGDMGLLESLASFMDLHRDEMVKTQEAFYRSGHLEWDLGYGKLCLEYQNEWQTLLEVSDPPEPFEALFDRWCEAYDWQAANKDHWELMKRMGERENPSQQNWWCIHPPDHTPFENWQGGYHHQLMFFNIFKEMGAVEQSEGLVYQSDLFKRVLPIDWRIISLIWRRHYGPLFRQMKQMHLEGDTLYVHGGLTPRVMIDSQSLGVIYRDGEDSFIDVENEQHYSTQNVVDRANRLMSQIVGNALNDYSFQSMNGLEVLDLMGCWRGGRLGFPQFGGAFWGDFEYLRMRWRNERVQTLYRQFLEATCIRRVICGHTRFNDADEETRFLQLKDPEEMGLDYICIDNSCSRGYRPKSVLNGIEIDGLGRILDPGKYV